MTQDPSCQSILAYCDPDAGPFPTVNEMALFCHGATVTWDNKKSAVQSAITPQTRAIVTNSHSIDAISELHSTCRKVSPGCHIALVTDKPHAEYSRLLGGNEHELIDHFIAFKHEAHQALHGFSITDLRATLQKIILDDFFGVEKYLKSGAPISSLQITSSADREPLHQAVVSFVLENGLSQTLATTARQIVQELLLNAIYDALNAAGRNKAREKSGRTLELAPDEQGTLTFGFDGSMLAIGVRDPFGLFKKDTFFNYARKALFRANSDAIIDTKVEGAGLGLMTVYLRSHGLICNVQPSVATEVISLIDVHSKTRDFEKFPRSLHYFDAAKKGRRPDQHE